MRSKILQTAPADPSKDFPCQMSKLAAGVLTDRYVPLGAARYAIP